MTDLQILNEINGIASGLKPGEVSTGTTILALPYEGGVLVCADSRTSTGTYVANRVSDKLVQISEQIYVCRSGSAADTQTLTDYVHYYLNQVRQVNHGFTIQICIFLYLARFPITRYSCTKQNYVFARFRE